jgi:hypothetical protein
MRRQDKSKREPRRPGLAALASLQHAADIVCLRCNESAPRATAEPFRTWGHVCESCAKQLRTIDAKAAERARA